MASLFSTTAGHDICQHMIRVVEKLELNLAKLCGLQQMALHPLQIEQMDSPKNIRMPLEDKM